MDVSGNISAVLGQKPPEIFSVTPDTCVDDAVRMMDEKNVGALLVMKGNKLVGMLSERDYTRKVMLRGKKSSETKPKRGWRFPYRKPGDIEKEIMERESRIEQLQVELSSPDVLRDGRRVKQVQAAISDEQQAVKALYEHWEEAVERCSSA